MYGFNQLPSYDFYLKYDLSDFGLKASRRYCHMDEMRTSGGTPPCRIYDEDINQFTRVNEESPGLASEFDHGELSYAPDLAGYKWTTKVYFDAAKVSVSIVANVQTLAQSLVHWSEWAGGVQSQVAKDFTLAGIGLGKGNALLGVQIENTEVYESTLASGINPSLDRPMATPALAPGKERAYAAFGQVKQWLADNLILNLGVRYDYKQRREDPKGLISIADVAQVSPRAALMYALTNEFDFRLSYGHCFVDAPYWYRYNNLQGYTGAITLKPESMNSYQFTVGEKLWENYLTHQVNFFYNDYKDVVYRDAAQIYSNAGSVQANGIEYEIAFKQKDLSARLNYTFQNFTEVSGLVSRWDMLESVPEHMGNLIVDYAPLYGVLDQDWAKTLWLNLGVRYVGRQFARWGKSLTNPRDTVDPAFVCNFGITAEDLVPGVTVGVHAYNLLNQQYFQGGSVEYPFMQPGRWFLAELSYTF
jgi:iron complex outermembrane receptor protein